MGPDGAAAVEVPEKLSYNDARKGQARVEAATPSPLMVPNNSNI